MLPDDTATKFKWVVQALAQPAYVQRRLYPPFAEVADELALEQEEWQAAYLALWRDKLSAMQRDALAALDRQLDAMSGPQHASTLWTSAALDDRPAWNEVRALAHALLRAMGWPAVSPPLQRGAIYIEAKGPAKSTPIQDRAADAE